MAISFWLGGGGGGGLKLALSNIGVSLGS